ncbi:MAG: hypothetical protein F6K10_38570 [Moorea sp. SIO2B7]|nr:hypothetical protein [Moorena sp. SIO2B7]
MVMQNIIEKQYTIKGNEPLLLDDPQKVWVVKSGSMVLFSTLIEEGEQKGSRKYLFNVSPSEALFGAALAPGINSGEQRGIIAVALQETELIQLTLENLTAEVVAGSQEAIALVENWVKHLGEWISDQPKMVAKPTDLVLAEGAHFLSLLKSQGLTPAKDEIVWVEVRSGSTLWMGMEDLKWSQESSLLPLSPGMWLEAENQVEVYTSPIAESENPEQHRLLPTNLAQLHAYFFHYFNLLQQKQTKADFRRFQERQQLNRQVAESSMGQLAAVLQPQKSEFFDQGTSLLIAAGAVGRALGIKVSPPAQSEDLDRVKEPLEAISRASQFRTRRVLLVGDWWKEEYGPLLGYTLKENSPIALLPGKGNRYVMFDPEKRTRTPVDEAVAESLSPEAYMFYRPLPQSIKNAAGVFLFGIKGL